MRHLVWTLPLALLAPAAKAAVKNYAVSERIPIVEDGARSYQSRVESYPFRLEIVADDDGPLNEERRGGRPFVAARPGQRYSIRLYNPLPVRAAVNLTVDGLNSISGKPSGIVDGAKWMIEPNSTLVLRGWQVNQGESRRFFFTDKPASYAAWQGEKHDMDLAANCGVIGAAFFWNRGELRDYVESHPIYRESPRPWIGASADKGMGAGGSAVAGKAAASSAPSAAMPAPARAQEAGTGMGERESNPTEQVEFSFDEGMYRPAQALLVYYDYPRPEIRPNPFPSISFASEMPERGIER